MVNRETILVHGIERQSALLAFMVVSNRVLVPKYFDIFDGLVEFYYSRLGGVSDCSFLSIGNLCILFFPFLF